jgi:hypothetical protein
MIFFIGLILSVLVFLIGSVAPTQLLLLGLLEFVGVFLTGWALIGYAVSKDMLEGQRFIALFFALVVLVGLFALAPYFAHTISIGFSIV